MEALITLLAFAWLALTLSWILTFFGPVRRAFARRLLAPYRIPLRRVRWGLGLSSIIVFVAFGIATQPAKQPAPSAAISAASATPVAEPSTAMHASVIAAATPSASALAAPDAHTAGYLAQLREQTTELRDSMNTFVDLASAPRLTDDSWKLQMAEQFAIWRVAYANAQKLQPPPGWEAWHAQYVSMLRTLDGASQEFAEGMDQMDAQKVYAGAQQVREATRRRIISTTN